MSPDKGEAPQTMYFLDAKYIRADKVEPNSGWVSVDTDRPTDKESIYWVNSSYGIVLAYLGMGQIFQDVSNNNDEGMEDWDGLEFEVYDWIAIDKPEPPKDKEQDK